MRATFHGFKKVASDEKSTTFKHPNGSTLKVAHAALDKKTLKQLHKMPMHMAEGGEAQAAETPDEDKSWLQRGAEWVGEQGANAVNDQIRPYKMIAGAASDVLGGMAHGANRQIGKIVGDDKLPPEPVPTNVNMGQPAPPEVGPNVGDGGAPSPLQPTDPAAGLQTQMAGVQNEARATGQMEAEKAKMYAEHTQELKRINDDAIQMHQANAAETQNMIEDMKSGHIDPKHYVNNMSGGQKVSTAIGLLLGGMGQGLIGGSNPALDMLNKSVDDDIHAQMTNRDNKQTVFNAMQKQYGNKVDAMNMTRAFYTAKLQNDVQTAAAKFGSPIAMARAQQIVGPLQQQLNAIHQQTAIRQAAMRGGGAADPASLVPYLVPKEHQQKVFDEIDVAQNVARSSKEIMTAFDNAANKIHTTDFVPGMNNADQKALHALMGPTFKDVEGTVRQAAMDNMFANVTPQFGDNKNTLATKRNALMGYLGSKISAPTAKGYGLDLTKFRSTNYGGAGFKKR